ncbi:hypothetical protein R3W88_025575 [Solanum pinnatisectum]|uniref:RRM domain-containing protein n=1 Tax=Solanum pinnatisectum TaxID=50273 RepID=A0AAV9M592_9SOLN|nr:hypothetical protein R3W88_025575 [Solanum pinnatisectum]
MSLSRLLSLKLRPLINTVECRRWCSSVNGKGEISQPLKKSEVMEQLKATDVEIAQKKHMTENEEVFPRETRVQKEVDPWNSLVATFQIIKKKIFGNIMEQKSSSAHSLTSTSDLKDSDNVVSAYSHDSGSMNNLKSTIHSEKTSITNMEENVDSKTSLSSFIAVEIVNMKNTSNTEKLLNISSKEYEGSTDYRVNDMSGASSICGKADSNDGAQLINDFHHSEFVKKEREQLLAEEASSSVQISSGEEILSKFEDACIVEHRMQIEIPRTSNRISANKSGSTASESQEDIMKKFKFSSNLKHGRRDTSDSSCVSKRVASLVDVSQEKGNNEPELEAKNGQMPNEEIQDIMSVFDNRTSDLKQVECSNSFLLSEATNKWRDVLVKKPVSSANEHYPAKDISIPISLSNTKMDEISSVSPSNERFPAKDTSIPIPLSNTKMDEISSVSNRSSHMETDHRAINQIVAPKSEKSVPSEFEHLNETSQNTFGKSGDIKGLIECIRVLPPQNHSVVRPEEIVVDIYSGRKASNSTQAQTNKQSTDRKKSKTSSQGVIGKKGGISSEVLDDLNPGDERTEIRNTAPRDFFKSIETEEITSLREKGNLNKDEDASLSEYLSDENKMTIKFVNVKATEQDVCDGFKGCGAITKVVFPSVISTNYKVAHIYFESKKGKQKALKCSDVIIRNVVVVEATFPPKGRERICIPDLIGYPEVPTSLVKHPSRTVMIKELKHNVSFHDIEEALAFCGSNITGIFFGSSSSIAYVEFETVEGKEIAIAKHSLIMLGETLSILRIDAPRTTIVRVSNIPDPSRPKVISFCKSLGQTRYFFTKAFGNMDVHFKFAEWPRMLEIINRLNGIEVDGQQLVAKPAPIYPPDVLKVLWSQPEGRKHLKTTFNSMLLKVGGGSIVGLTELVDKFYADVQET